MRILIIEKDRLLLAEMEKVFKEAGYAVICCYDGAEGFKSILNNVYDLIILDLYLPLVDGLTIVRKVREKGIITPIILLSDKKALEDKVDGLNLGANDFLTKPFEMREILARAKVIFRVRNFAENCRIIAFGDFKVDLEELSIVKGDLSYSLTVKEKDIIQLLIMRGSMISSKDYIIENVWGYDSKASDNNVEVYIFHLRKKLKAIDSEVKINTIRFFGYRLSLTSEI